MTRFSINKRECNCSITKFYEKAARKADLDISDITTYDNEKISITEPIRKSLYKYYADLGLADDKIEMLFSQYGPKSTLEGNKYEFEIDDGFAYELGQVLGKRDGGDS